MINVTRTDLPPLDEYVTYLKRIWESHWLTNEGPLHQELEQKLRSALDVDHLVYVSNGTISLQIAIQALALTGEIITTPFSYVATTNSILWEHCTPVFADIRSDDFCIDHRKIEKLITPKTTAIMAVHVFGYPCDVYAIEKIGKKHGLKVIYDAAHAFGVKLDGRSLAKFGDISSYSFHSTKIFHTVEGGALTCSEAALADRLRLSRSFGHRKENYIQCGINAKNSEFHSAMGLALLPKLPSFIQKRRILSELYREHLDGPEFQMPKSVHKFDQNYSYFPVVLRSELELLKIERALNNEQIFPRRYFYPSLNDLPYFKGESCPISEDISRRVLCLPLYSELLASDVERICSIIRNAAK